MKRVFILLMASLLIANSCIELEIVVPRGRITGYERPTHIFRSVSVSGGMELIIRQGNRQEVIIEANENLHQYIITEVIDKTLRIYPMRGVTFTGSPLIRVYLTTDILESVYSGGGGLVDFENGWDDNYLICSISGGGELWGYLDLLKMDLSLSGGSSAFVDGYCDELFFKSSGGGETDARGLLTQFSWVNISGGGVAVLNVSDYLNVVASGGSKVSYLGTPEVWTSLSGGSVVRRY
ncbi:hypothetical protein SDC9_148536 [bioreactor metagenome]|uniref:Putative auto-transporter adhesin head GIN domain-containing protein n=1 Tax=bioreactor metagenome TaxID=1076179 RepID=A0A645EHU7_9ZZZZ|nr:head GIN domain-containing protein [Rikenellaceae bacterium]